MQVIIHKILTEDRITHHCLKDTTLGKAYECRKFNKGDQLVNLKGEAFLDLYAAEDSFLFKDDVRDDVEIFVSDVSCTFVS